MLFTFEKSVPLMRFGASVVWQHTLLLMNSFHKTEAVIFPMQATLPKDLPLFSDYYNAKSIVWTVRRHPIWYWGIQYLENSVQIMRWVASIMWHRWSPLINSFNKTEAPVFLRTFLFTQNTLTTPLLLCFIKNLYFRTVSD